nr:transposase family protein [Paracoccus seriniphilus]
MRCNIPWPAQGKPLSLHVDNGRDFRSRAFRSACAEWGIDLVYRPPGSPHFGGHIERLIGTMMGAVHLLPGTTQSSVAATQRRTKRCTANKLAMPRRQKGHGSDSECVSSIKPQLI